LSACQDVSSNLTEKEKGGKGGAHLDHDRLKRRPFLLRLLERLLHLLLLVDAVLEVGQEAVGEGIGELGRKLSKLAVQFADNEKRSSWRKRRRKRSAFGNG
jgi:hypothetical protein